MTRQPFSDEEKSYIRESVRNKYKSVSRSAQQLFSYPTGKQGAIILGYDQDILNSIADEFMESFCGVGNPFNISTIAKGSSVLDIGCGAGFDLIVANRLVGPEGRVCGVDLTPEMIDKARVVIETSGDINISVQQVLTEELPYPDNSFDYVISNGVINLSPAKLALFEEILRVLKPNGVLQFADVSLAHGKTPKKSISTRDWAQ